MKICDHCHANNRDEAPACKLCGGHDFTSLEEIESEILPDNIRTVTRAVVWDHEDEWSVEEVDEKH